MIWDNVGIKKGPCIVFFLPNKETMHSGNYLDVLKENLLESHEGKADYIQFSSGPEAGSEGHLAQFGHFSF